MEFPTFPTVYLATLLTMETIKLSKIGRQMYVELLSRKFLGVTEKDHENLSWFSRSPSRDLNIGHPEYVSRKLLLDQLGKVRVKLYLVGLIN
jgi:hypothetical protein